MNTIISILISVLVFSSLILVHECGHFFTAKLTGIYVEEFAIGMGPALLKFRKGETLYTIRAFPIGGYVKMEGEDGDGTSTRAFNKKPLLARFLVLFAGAGMNFVAAFLVSIGLVISLSQIASNTVNQFSKTAESSQYGLQSGDEILKMDDRKVNIITDINMLLSESGGKPFDITVRRNGEIILLSGVKFPVETYNNVKVSLRDFSVKPAEKTIFSTVRYAYYQCLSLTKSIWRSLGGLVTGKINISQLSGPVGTTQVIGEAAKAGVSSLLFFFIFISINLGIMNLLPFPALDGGRIMILLIEKLRRKPLNQKFEGMLNFIGFALLMLLMVAVTFNDVFRLLR